jgi:Cof subfamily protein (haloacid dehalogenase superfamily)
MTIWLLYLLMKGWLALDIDGTITQDKYRIPIDVIEYLSDCVQSGWKIAFATGRAFVFARQALEKIPFSFILMPQNGSVAVRMPTQEILFKRYMSPSILGCLDEATGGKHLIYSGIENGDRCYYLPENFSKNELHYMDELQTREKEEWVQGVINFDFPFVKCFGKLEAMKKVESKILKSEHFDVSLIRDPFHSSYYILLITNKNTSKGTSLQELFLREGRGKLVIAAGDDVNDLSLLQAADVRIAMPHAPEELRKIADFIAPSVEENGIIQALKICVR